MTSDRSLTPSSSQGADQTERDLESRNDQPFERLRERLWLEITRHRTNCDREQREHPRLVTGDTEDAPDAYREERETV